MDIDLFEKEKEVFLNSLILTKNEKINLETSTTLQAESGLWIEERRKRLTASNFYRVYKTFDNKLHKYSSQSFIRFM